MLHTFAHRHEAASLYECCLALIELTALPEIKFTGDEGHDLIHGMGVRRDPAVGRELQAQDERSFLGRIDSQERRLSVLGQDGRCRRPCDLSRARNEHCL